jgi:hypothetical protein
MDNFINYSLSEHSKPHRHLRFPHSRLFENKIKKRIQNL